MTPLSTDAGRLYDLNTPYGSKEELVALLKALREAGIKAVGDIVSFLPLSQVSHRAHESKRKYISCP